MSDICMCCGCINGEHFNCVDDLHRSLAKMQQELLRVTEERDRLKSELEAQKFIEGEIIDARNELELDRDKWKLLAEGLAEALKSACYRLKDEGAEYWISHDKMDEALAEFERGKEKA